MCRLLGVLVSFWLSFWSVCWLFCCVANCNGFYFLLFLTKIAIKLRTFFLKFFSRKSIHDDKNVVYFDDCTCAHGQRRPNLWCIIRLFFLWFRCEYFKLCKRHYLNNLLFANGLWQLKFVSTFPCFDDDSVVDLYDAATHQKNKNKKQTWVSLDIGSFITSFLPSFLPFLLLCVPSVWLPLARRVPPLPTTHDGSWWWCHTSNGVERGVLFVYFTCCHERWKRREEEEQNRRRRRGGGCGQGCRHHPALLTIHGWRWLADVVTLMDVIQLGQLHSLL